MVERGEEEAPRSRRSPVSPALLVIGGVLAIAIVIVIVAMA